MGKLVVAFFIAIGLCGAGAPDPAYADAIANKAARQLQTWIVAAGGSGRRGIGKERVHIGKQICAFYEGRDYQPAWSQDDGPGPQVDGLISAIRHADREGLRPVGYHLSAMQAAAKKLKQRWSARTPKQLAEYDLLLTDAFLTYGSDLFYGRQTRSLDASLSADRRSRDLAQLLEIALKVNDMEAALESLLPAHQGYARLRQALAHHREAAASKKWPRVAAGPKMQPGDHGKRVRALRQRLIASGDLAAQTEREAAKTKKNKKSKQVTVVDLSAVRFVQVGQVEQLTDEGSGVSKPTVFPQPVKQMLPLTPVKPVLPVKSIHPSMFFDEAVEQAVRRFQKKHGLGVDGVVGPATLAALNVSPKYRARQIALNMERWRSYPHNFGNRYVLVNVASSSLDVMEDGESVLHMRTVVGKKKKRWQTPVFSDTMEYVVLNPNWYIPPSIAKREILPSAKRDPSSLRRRGIRVFSSRGAVDPSRINWGSISAKNLPYRFQQKPGRGNALGKMKFIFPNRYNVYLHDTPSKAGFKRESRALSHGCVRLERPLDLAEYVLQNNKNWSRKKILKTLKRRKTRRVNLSEPLPVHLLYWTVEVNDDGTLQFYPDVYDSDKGLAKALGKNLAV
jgi:murein L,D-transpeptidase YcbB/YkuD